MLQQTTNAIERMIDVSIARDWRKRKKATVTSMDSGGMSSFDRKSFSMTVIKINSTVFVLFFQAISSEISFYVMISY